MDAILERMYKDRAWYVRQLDDLDEYDNEREIEDMMSRIAAIDEEIRYYTENGSPTPWSGY